MNIRYVFWPWTAATIERIPSLSILVSTYWQTGIGRDAIGLLQVSGTQECLEGIFGKQAIGTFRVSPVECWPEHNDPKRFYIDEFQFTLLE